MSKNVLRNHFEDLKDAGYTPYRKQKAADAVNRRITRENRRRQTNCSPAEEEITRPTRSYLHRKPDTKTRRNNFLQALKAVSNWTRTENGAKTLRSSGSEVLDLFASIGALRSAKDFDILRRFCRAWTDDRELAMKILFYARDVRGGLGERRVFHTILRYLAFTEPESVRKNIGLLPFYGRFDDLLDLLETPCETDALRYIRERLEKDKTALEAGKPVSLLAKWLPSINASSEEARRQAVIVARGLGMSDSQYRKTLSALRKAEHILENDLRERNYHFPYADQPSGAMFKYREAFLRNDRARYRSYLQQVRLGKQNLHTGSVMPYDLVRAARFSFLNDDQRDALDVTWNKLEDFTDNRNALVVIDGSGSMYCGGNPLPAEVALSLGMYFAERNTGLFKDCFITFSMNPQLVKIKGHDLVERVRYCESFDEVANTNIQAVFELILKAALLYRLPQSELPETVYIISDMEFDWCTENADMTNFEYAKRLFESNGYKLPNLVFWNVQSRNQQVPVRMNDKGVALVSGCSPRIFSMVMQHELDPYKFMMKIIGSERYAQVHA